MTNNKYGCLVIEKDKDNEFLDTDDDEDTLQIDRESQHLLVDDIATTSNSNSNSVITTNNNININSKNSKGRRTVTTFIVVVLLVIFGVAVVGSSYNLFGEGETMVISTAASASSFDNSVVINEIENEVEDGNKNKSDNNSNNNNHEHSPFFNVTLPWKQVQMSDSLSSNSMNNHYKAVIEFCSDPKQDLYGYGLLGECIPGQTTVLIRMKPKQFYRLTLVNNGHINTNLHTHGLHVSGVGTSSVYYKKRIDFILLILFSLPILSCSSRFLLYCEGTVDDVTRVVEPGKCITYDVSLCMKNKNKK